MPTGPRALSAAYSTQAQLAEPPEEDFIPAFGNRRSRSASLRTVSPAPVRDDVFEDQGDDDMIGSPRRGRIPTGKNGARRSPSRGGGGGGVGIYFEGPLRNEEQIREEHGKNIKLKQQWTKDPKAPLAVHGVTEYSSEEGWVQGQRVFR